MAKGSVRNDVSGETLDEYTIYKDRIHRKMRDLYTTREVADWKMIRTVVSSHFRRAPGCSEPAEL
jgi:hypothetical protein